MTNTHMGCKVITDESHRFENSISYFLLFRVAEIHRIDETTATPEDGRGLPERVTRTIRDLIILDN